MSTPAIQSYSAQVRTAPPRVETFSAGSDAEAALLTARRWVEDRAREFLEEHSLPRNPWEAGGIFAGEVSSEHTLAELVVYTSDGDYVFGWDDQD
ncbi:MAG TPA: hypothetical protein VFD38_18510 [Myxococcaceae bacterium]|nr:hypothetical protein [Myxococcaceae bacterium]